MELCTFHFRGASAAGEVDFSYGHYIRDLARVGAECGVSNGRAGCVERGCSTFGLQKERGLLLWLFLAFAERNWSVCARFGVV